MNIYGTLLKPAERKINMESAEKRTPRHCPLCGAEYSERPALSRVDGTTEICPDCGTRQALEDIGISEEEREKIISIIHSRGGNAE